MRVALLLLPFKTVIQTFKRETQSELCASNVLGVFHVTVLQFDSLLVATTILTWFKWRLASVQPLCPFILFGHPFLPTNVPWFKNKTVNLDLLPPKTRLPGAGFVRKNPKSPRSIWRWYMHRFLLLFLRADLVRGWSCRQRETARRHQQHHWQ